MSLGILKIFNSLLAGNLTAGLEQIFELPQAALDILYRPCNPDFAEILLAARLLKTGEFQFLQSAFSEWHGREMTEAEINQHFRSFIIDQKIPWWARQSARKIIHEGAREKDAA